MVSFSEAFAAIRDGKGAIRLSTWEEGIVLRVQITDENSKMTQPYIYMECGEDKFPWGINTLQLFSMDWEIVNS